MRALSADCFRGSSRGGGEAFRYRGVQRLLGPRAATTRSAGIAVLLCSAALRAQEAAPHPAASNSAPASVAAPAAGVPPAITPQGQPAQWHFELALDHYRNGRYGAAVTELDAAILLDPNSKDLVFDLALVQEKLGDLDAAVQALVRYQELETDPRELERARLAVERMRGARDEVLRVFELRRRATEAAARSEPAARSADPWFLATASVSVAAAVVGTVFGLQALSQRPDLETRADRSTQWVRSQQARADDSARIADWSFAFSLIAGSAATVLWLRPPADLPSPAVSRLGLSWRGNF